MKCSVLFLSNRFNLSFVLLGIVGLILPNVCFQEEMPQISYSELSDLEGISQGGFGLAYRAKHARFGTVVYKELDVKILGNKYSNVALFSMKSFLYKYILL